jgi:histidinol-phosphate/aromatic aminotransferase/cobyric acid decarboxylase-like protein
VSSILFNMKNEHTVKIINEHTIKNDVSMVGENEQINSVKNCVQTTNNEVEKLTDKITDMNIVQQLPRKTTFHLFLANTANGAKAQKATLSDRIILARKTGTTHPMEFRDFYQQDNTKGKELIERMVKGKGKSGKRKR